MNAPDTIVAPVDWPEIGPSRVPYPVYTDPALYREELERFFYRGHWCYVGLEAEIPEAGDFKRSRVGERSVIMVRSGEDEISVVENRCAHRASSSASPNRPLQGADLPVPPVDLRPERRPAGRALPARRRTPGRHAVRLRARGAQPDQAAVEVFNGVVLATFRPRTCRRFAEYFGPRSSAVALARVFDGRKLHVLGYNRQHIPGNWKLMQENIKDPYHPGLLHTWFVAFGLWRADQKSQSLSTRRAATPS